LQTVKRNIGNSIEYFYKVMQEEPFVDKEIKPYREKWSWRSLCCYFSGGFGISRRDTSGYLYQISYEYFLRTAKTGDLILFEGKGLSSCLIQCSTQVRYSHIGMVLRIRDEKASGQDHIFIWESTRPDQTYDFLTGTDKDGPRLISAHERIFTYARNNYTVTYRPMKIWDSRIIEQMGSGLTDLYMWATILLMSRLPYELNMRELANAHLRMITGIDNPNQKSIFCSELVAITYRNGMGLSLTDIETGIQWAPQDFTPEDFAEQTQGIPFAKDSYSRDGMHMIRPAQTTYSGQYVLSSYSHIDSVLVNLYRGFLTSGRERLDIMFGRGMPTVKRALMKFKEFVEKSAGEGEEMQNIPVMDLTFVYRTDV